MNEFPKLDPITGRKICANCWSGVHYHEMQFRRNHLGKMENYYVKRYRLQGKAEHACNGECDCIHRSEESWAAIEKQKAKVARKERREFLKEQLEDPSNPLVCRTWSDPS